MTQIGRMAGLIKYPAPLTSWMTILAVLVTGPTAVRTSRRFLPQRWP